MPGIVGVPSMSRIIALDGIPSVSIGMNLRWA